MHTIIFSPLLGLALGASTALAKEPDTFHQAFLENIELQVTTKAEGHVGSVIRAPIHTVRFEAFAGHSDSPSYGIIEVFESGGRLIPVEIPVTNQTLSWLDDLIHSDFLLNSDSADAFLEVLKLAMPADFFDEFEGKRIQRSGNEWHFLTGEFFDNLKGFIVTVDGNGHITGVSYSLEL